MSTVEHVSAELCSPAFTKNRAREGEEEGWKERQVGRETVLHNTIAPKWPLLETRLYLTVRRKQNKQTNISSRRHSGTRGCVNVSVLLVTMADARWARRPLGDADTDPIPSIAH